MILPAGHNKVTTPRQRPHPTSDQKRFTCERSPDQRMQTACTSRRQAVTVKPFAPHPPDPTGPLVPHNNHPIPTIPTKNPTLKHKPTQLCNSSQTRRAGEASSVKPFSPRPPPYPAPACHAPQWNPLQPPTGHETTHRQLTYYIGPINASHKHSQRASIYYDLQGTRTSCASPRR